MMMKNLNVNAQNAALNLIDNPRFAWKWRLSDIKQDKNISVFSCFSCGGGQAWDIKEQDLKSLETVKSTLK